MFSLKGQTALITGGSRGIGAAISKRLASAGAFVLINYRSNQEAAETLLNDIRQNGGDGALLPFDLGDTGATEGALAATLEKGPISILVCNAGIAKESLIPRASAEHFEEIFKTNFFSAAQITRQVARSMMREKYGRVVLMSSIIGEIGNKGQAAYSSSKSALFGFSKSFAQEFASRNITCNVVCPGFINTEMTDRLGEDLKQAYLDKIPVGRFGSVEDVAALVHFLVSGESGYITGSTLDINGGLLMR